MNDKLLLQKRINIPNQYLNFLSFIHPHFDFVEDIDKYDNPKPYGIIYTGSYSDNVIPKLNRRTSNWIIVNNHHFDYDLTTTDGLIKYLLPINYTKLKNDKKQDALSVYTRMNYHTLLEKIKYCLITNSLLTPDDEDEQSVFSIFTALLSTEDILNSVYFSTVTKDNISRITSAILTFLIKVQSNNIKNEQVYYARLITQSNKRYGKHIKYAVSQFVKSKADKIIALHHLLLYLNRPTRIV